jgi:sec-independent protein translocase protein TatA
MFRQIGTGEIILIAVVLVFLFGARKLPELAKSIGKSIREFRAGMSDAEDEDEDEKGNGSGEAGAA